MFRDENSEVCIEGSVLTSDDVSARSKILLCEIGNKIDDFDDSILFVAGVTYE
jgi:hypothetical protein